MISQVEDQVDKSNFKNKIPNQLKLIQQTMQQQQIINEIQNQNAHQQLQIQLDNEEQINKTSNTYQISDDSLEQAQCKNLGDQQQDLQKKYMEVRKQKKQSQMKKQEFVQNFRVDIEDSQLTKRLEKTLQEKKQQQMQKSNVFIYNSQAKQQNICYPCAGKQKTKQKEEDHSNKKDNSSQQTSNKPTQLQSQQQSRVGVNSQFGESYINKTISCYTAFQSQTPPQKIVKTEFSSQEQPQMMEGIQNYYQHLEQENQEIKPRLEYLFTQNEELTKQLNLSKQSVEQLQYQLTYIVRRTRNQILANNLLMYDEKLLQSTFRTRMMDFQDETVKNILEKKLDEAQLKLCKVIPENEKILREFELEKIQQMMQEIVQDKFDLNTAESQFNSIKIDMVNEIERYRLQHELDQKLIDKLTSKVNDYSVQINRFLENDSLKSSSRDGLKNTIYRILQLEKELQIWDTNYASIQKQNEQLTSEITQLQHENEIYLNQLKNDRTKILEDIIAANTVMLLQSEKPGQQTSNSNIITQANNKKDLIQQFMAKLEYDLAECRLQNKGLKEKCDNVDVEISKKQNDYEVITKKYKELNQEKEEIEVKLNKLESEKQHFQDNVKLEYELAAKEMESANQNFERQLREAHETILNLEKQLLSQTNPKINKFVSEEQQLVEQLALIILSKDKSNFLGENTKKLIKDVFGDNFSKIVEKYEANIADNNKELNLCKIQNQKLIAQKAVFKRFSLNFASTLLELIKLIQSASEKQQSQGQGREIQLNQLLGQIKEKLYKEKDIIEARFKELTQDNSLSQDSEYGEEQQLQNNYQSRGGSRSMGIEESPQIKGHQVNTPLFGGGVDKKWNQKSDENLLTDLNLMENMGSNSMQEFINLRVSSMANENNELKVEIEQIKSKLEVSELQCMQLQQQLNKSKINQEKCNSPSKSKTEGQLTSNTSCKTDQNSKQNKIVELENRLEELNQKYEKCKFYEDCLINNKKEMLDKTDVNQDLSMILMMQAMALEVVLSNSKSENEDEDDMEQQQQQQLEINDQGQFDVEQPLVQSLQTMPYERYAIKEENKEEDDDESLNNSIKKKENQNFQKVKNQFSNLEVGQEEQEDQEEEQKIQELDAEKDFQDYDEEANNQHKTDEYTDEQEDNEQEDNEQRGLEQGLNDDSLEQDLNEERNIDKYINTNPH